MLNTYFATVKKNLKQITESSLYIHVSNNRTTKWVACIEVKR